MSYNDPKHRVTLSGKPPEPGYEGGDKGAPAPIDPRTGMHKDYWVLPEEERRKGFIRPFRDQYKHVGIRPKYPLRDLTPEEDKRFNDEHHERYVKYEEYPPGSSSLGRFWSEKDLKSGCGAVTNMGRALSETYARDPSYYGSTFCTRCCTHFPVAEFIWTQDGERVGS